MCTRPTAAWTARCRIVYVANVDLTGKRILVVGAETGPGRAIAVELADDGATVAAVATSNDPDTAFAMKRLSRKLGGPAQAIDATNDMAVRVMVRQIAKELGGLDAIVCAVPEAAPLLAKHGGKQLDRSEGRHFVIVGDGHPPLESEVEEGRHTWILVTVRSPEGDDEAAANAVARVVSGRQLLD